MCRAVADRRDALRAARLTHAGWSCHHHLGDRNPRGQQQPASSSSAGAFNFISITADGALVVIFSFLVAGRVGYYCLRRSHYCEMIHHDTRSLPS